MASQFRKIQKSANQYEIEQIYKNMTPEDYRATIAQAVKNAVTDLGKEYDKQLVKMQENYNKSIRDAIMIAMDTISVEILYELGNLLECYVDEPDHLEQKVDVVQNLYQTAMDSIKKYANYKTDNQAQKVFKKKKKTIEKVFHIYGEEVE